MKKYLFLVLVSLIYYNIYGQWLGTNPVYFNAGFVGIGTSSPQGRLHVNPVRPIILKENGGNGVYGSEIGFNSVLNTSVVPNQFKKLGGTSQQGGANIAVDYQGNMLFQMANAPNENEFVINHNPQVAFLNNGNVGIGTATPQAKLDVRGAVSFAGGRLTHQGDIANDNNAVFVNTAASGYGIYSKGGLSTHYAFHFENQVGSSIMYGGGNGNVGIGTTTPGSFKLAVEGKIGAREVNVTTAAWSDYVFKEDYHLRPLAEVQEFIKENHHLPDVPSEKEVLQNGQDLGAMNAVLLKKIEELTLYQIEANRKIELLQSEILKLKKD